MTDKEFLFCLKEAEQCENRDAYISDLSLSSIWGDSEDDAIQTERLYQIGYIWDAAHRSIPDISKAAGISMRQLAERFCIPYRTVENWSAGSRSCPLYVSIMMQEILGLLHRP